MYSIHIENRCLRELKRLDREVVRRAFRVVREILATNPYSGKRLKGRYAGLYSYRVSEYRIVYEIVSEELRIVVLRIGHRKYVYDGL